MSTQQLLDHDLNANGHRILGARGADVTIASNAVTLGNGNLFRIIAGLGGGDSNLMYIQTAGWTAGSIVYLEAASALNLVTGTSPPSGAASLLVAGSPAALPTGQVAELEYNGTNFVLVNVEGSSGGGDLLSPVAGGDFFLKGSGVGDDDWMLLRAPTTTNTSTVAITSGGGAGVLFNGPALRYGDPGWAVWTAGNAIVDFWLNVDSNSASFFVSIGRTLHGDGPPTWIVTDQPLGTIASTVPILVQVVFAFPQSVGSIDDGVTIKVTATTTTSCTATLGTGGANQSKINLPLPWTAAVALQSSTQAVFVNAYDPPTPGQVLTGTSDDPVQAKWANPAPAASLQTTGAAVVVGGSAAPTVGQVLTATVDPTVGAWQTPSYVPTLDDYLAIYEDFVDSDNLNWRWFSWQGDGVSGAMASEFFPSPQMGVVALLTGVSPSGYSYVQQNEGYGVNLTPGDRWNCFSDIMIPTLSNGTASFHVKFGFLLNTGSWDGSNWKLYVEYNHGVSSGKWTMYLYDSSLQTLVSTVTVTNQTWYRIQIQQVTSGAYSQFHLIINGVDKGYLQTSTTMTQMLFYPMWIQKAAGTASVRVNIDQTRLWTQGRSPRVVP